MIISMCHHSLSWDFQGHLLRLVRKLRFYSMQLSSFPLVTLLWYSLTVSVKPIFTFKTKSAFAGSPVSFQLCLHLQARKIIPLIVFSSVRLSFNEQIPEIVISNINANTQALQRFGPNVTKGSADLSLQAGKDKVLEFSYTPVAQAQIEVHPKTNHINFRH